MSKTQVAVAAMIGGVVGLGLFTFRYAEGLSYFSTEPKACANCHVMNDQYASWSKGPHHGTA
ncbi:MAG: cytochrome c nitrite reductase small subunit, partial [Polyangia bacterium]